MSVELPVVDQETIDLIFVRLSGMELELDTNPLIYGPKRLNQKIAEARKFQSKCEELFLNVSLWVQKYKSGVRAAKLSLDLSKKHLFTNDPEVRAGRNLADRDAIASMKLKDEVKEVSAAESTLEDLEAIIVVVRSKKGDLKDIQQRIKDQIRLCQEEISLGSRWGSKVHGKVDKPEEVDPNKKTLKQLHEMFQGQETPEPVKEEIPPEVQAPVEKEGTLLKGTYEEGMGDFLTAVSNTKVSETRPEEIDIDALLGDMEF